LFSASSLPSGISGGSVGAGAFLTKDSDARGDWYVESLGSRDFVSTPLARVLTVDLPRGLIGFHGVLDRAAFLERAWEGRVSGFDKNYFELLRPGPRIEQLKDPRTGATATRTTWMPITLFNGSQVETGCRVNTSALKLTAALKPTADSTGTDCRDLRRYEPTFTPETHCGLSAS
jgi:hypothetical protein